MTLNRRDLSKFAFGGLVAATAGPAHAFFHRRNTPEAIAERLVNDLNAAAPTGCGAVFSVPRVQTEDVPFWSIEVAVQVDWPPGMRRRPVMGVGANVNEAYEALLAEAKARFSEILTPDDGAWCLG